MNSVTLGTSGFSMNVRISDITSAVKGNTDLLRIILITSNISMLFVKGKGGKFSLIWVEP